MNKQEFIISQLKPYFEDPSICGIDNRGNCRYLTSDGKMCVFGKNMLPEFREKYAEDTSVTSTLILNVLGQDVLVEEARNILDTTEWRQMQAIHDSVATCGLSNIYGNITITRDIEDLARITNTDLSELLSFVINHNLMSLEAKSSLMK